MNYRTTKLDTLKRSVTGLTIIELVVVISISGFLITIVGAFALDYWGNTVSSSNHQASLVSRLNASDYLNSAIDQATGLINQNNIPDTNTGNADPLNSSGTYWLVLNAVPGLIHKGASGTITPVLYYNRASVDTSKHIIMNGAIPYEDNIMLYLDGSTNQLLARTLANTYAVGNRALTTCPAAIASSTCPADTVVAESVTSVSMRYFSRSGNNIDYTSIIDTNTGQFIGPNFPSVKIVEFTLNIAQSSFMHNAKAATNSTIIRVALRN
ncbi:hypothetical protein H7171_01285 [Candidatus Saccharibacteria bacterium]|nr:hypothetical protein [Candidatus Saccharibacteria bacterium]